MKPSKRIFYNTIAQYARSVINTAISLYTVRVVLLTLGEEDYGIWSIIGGVIMFLGFMTNAMVITTQRFLSYDYGSKSTEEVRGTFSNSIMLHLIFGTFILALLLLLEPWIVSPAFLNINPARWQAAHALYKIVTVILLTTFTTAPFKALLIARENIVFVSIVEVLDGIAKLLLTFMLPYCLTDRLVVYGFMLLGIMFMEFTIFSAYDITKYKECSPRHFLHDIKPVQIRRLSGFAGWTTFGMGAIIGRNQGLAWLINQFYGTVINTSYGIAAQVLSAVQFIGSSIANAVNPQIMKAEGKGDRQHMLYLSEQESRIIVCMLAIIFVPIMVEMPSILRWWLKEVPAYTALLCNAMLVAYMIDQTTSGLNAANQAMGNIRNYTLIMYIPKLLFLLAAYAMLYVRRDLAAVMGLYVAVELLVALARLPYLRHTSHLSMRHYIGAVYPRNLMLITVTALLSWGLHQVSSSAGSFFFILPVDCCLSCLAAWFLVLNNKERKTMIQIITNRKNK